MSREAEVDAWVRKPKRIIHDQSLIQILLVLAFVVPLPTVGIIFWLVFVVSPAIMIPCTILAWTVSAITYTALATYVKIKTN